MRESSVYPNRKNAAFFKWSKAENDGILVLKGNPRLNPVKDIIYDFIPAVLIKDLVEQSSVNLHLLIF